MSAPRCGWCKNEKDLKEVGTEWSGHAIMACPPPCGHEWVETSILRDPKKGDSFWDFLKDIAKNGIKFK